jgi:imidazolonepropionase-like amidohydrolase
MIAGITTFATRFVRTRGGRAMLAALLFTFACARSPRIEPVSTSRSYELRNGTWLDGFQGETRYVVNGRVSARRPARVDSVIDLAGGWVVPPYGEAHNHNVSYTGRARTDSVLARYVRDGVLYAQNPGDVPRGRDSLTGSVNVPGALSVTFANGLLTATGGHPTGLYQRNLARGGMTAADGDGGFLWIVDSLPDLERKWPRILAGHPDFVKTVLVHSEEFARRRTDTAFFNWRGLDPALLPEIVLRAHDAGLRVMTHVETAADFRVAVRAGADIIGHVPGFRGDEQVQLRDAAPYEIDRVDAREAARRGTWIVTTLGGIQAVDLHGPDSLRRRAFDRLAARNLRTLRDAGVRIAIGSDDYRDDSVNEVRYLAGLGVFDALALVRLWSESTPRAIFPARRVGCLTDGCEASLLVLRGNPALDLANTGRISLRMKDGVLLP